MSGGPQAGIPFENWGAIDQNEAQRMARDPDVSPLTLRLFFAALGRANRTGHAEFASEELAEILGSQTVDDVWRPVSRQQVTAVIARAKQVGLLHPESKARCLVLDSNLWRKGVGSSACSTHGRPPGRYRRRRP